MGERFHYCEPPGLRGNWHYYGPHERDGFVIQWSQNALDRSHMLSVYRDGRSVFSGRYFDHVYRGHCCGELIVRPVLERLKAKEHADG